jgi:hypothetical protein
MNLVRKKKEEGLKTWPKGTIRDTSPPSSRVSPLSLLLGKPVCDRMQLTSLLPLPSLQDSMLYVPNSRDLESALTLLSLQEDHCLLSPPLSLSPAPPPSPLLPSRSRSTRGVGINSPPSGRMGVKYLKSPYSRKTGVTKQRCTPQDPKKVLWFHTSNFFKKMQQEFGVWETQELFKWPLEEFGVEEFHDILGYVNCKWEREDIIYCRKSRHHHSHPFHQCPVWGVCCAPFEQLGL